MAKIKVLIADNQSIVRIGIRAFLDGTDRYVVVGEAEDAGTASDIASKHNPALVILDLDLPPDGAIGVLQEMKRSQPRVKVLVYTNDESEGSFFRAFHAGADGYLLKKSDTQALLDAMDVVADGGLFFGPRISDLMLKRFLAKPRVPNPVNDALLENLTKREVEVLTLIALGMTNQEIAEKLFISALTVHTHRTNLMKKLDAHGTAQLVRFAMEHGLVDRKTEESAS